MRRDRERGEDQRSRAVGGSSKSLDRLGDDRDDPATLVGPSGLGCEGQCSRAVCGVRTC